MQRQRRALPPPPPRLLRCVLYLHTIFRRCTKSIVQAKGSTFTGDSTVTDKLSATTNAAVAEGKADVAGAQATGAGYVDQAKAVASSAISTAQVSTILALRDLHISDYLA